MKGVVQGHDVRGSHLRQDEGGIEADCAMEPRLAASCLRALSTKICHQPPGQAEKMGAVVSVKGPLVHQPQNRPRGLRLRSASCFQGALAEDGIGQYRGVPCKPKGPAHEQLGHRMWRLLRHRRLRSMRVAVKIARHSGLVNEDGTNGRMIPLVALPQKIPAFRECF
jgi:hypothetical protein